MFNKRLKERVRYLELRLGQVEDLSIHAVEEGYAAKGSPAEDRFKVLADIASLALRDELTYAPMPLEGTDR